MDEETLRSQQISKEMKKDFKEKSKVVKLLLLGTGAVKDFYRIYIWMIGITMMSEDIGYNLNNH